MSSIKTKPTFLLRKSILRGECNRLFTNKNKMKHLIETFISDGTNKGYCWGCQKYYKKGDVVIVFDKVRVDRVFQKKICGVCYLKLLADKIGWNKLNALIIKNSEEKI